MEWRRDDNEELMDIFERNAEEEKLLKARQLNVERFDFH